MECSKEILKLTIYGQPCTKKDSTKIIRHRTFKRKTITYLASFTGWKKDALMQLGLCGNGYLKRKIKEPIDYPVVMKYHLFFKDKPEVKLLDYFKTINDILIESKILKSSEVVIDNFSKVFYNNNSPKIIIWILKK